MKRSFDILFSAAGLLFLSPVLLALAIAVRISSRGPVLFRQLRIGKDGRPFYIVKLRSMVAHAENAGPSITPDGDPRITSVGRILRKSKLDELPQLWNVLVGEMSFVGPRPEVPRYVERYTAEQRRVLALKPGITDVATIEFRNEEEVLREKSRVQIPNSKVQSPFVLESLGPSVPLRNPKSKIQNPGDRKMEEFYMNYCVPRKIELNLEYAARATFWSDIGVIWKTVVPWGNGRRKSKV